MDPLQPSPASLLDRVRFVPAPSGVFAAYFIGRTAAFVLAEEAILLVPPNEAERQVTAHDGGILAAASDGAQIVTTGDDGAVVAISGDGEREILATDAKRRWIDRVAVGPDNSVAWCAGKTAYVRTGAGDIKALDLPSAVGGLAFAPKGFRLAISHYNGVSLWFPNAAAKPEVLEWKGSHLDVLFSPDGKFLVTAMQEPMLHGWRLADRKHMRMSGYSAKVRSHDWSAGGDWLASSGSEQLILWPFQGKDGPMGKQPRMLAPREVRVAAVACHPQQQVVAVGFADGMVLLVRIEDGAEVLARKPDGVQVAAIAWSKSGDLLAYGAENGDAGVLPV